MTLDALYGLMEEGATVCRTLMQQVRGDADHVDRRITSITAECNCMSIVYGVRFLSFRLIANSVRVGTEYGVESRVPCTSRR